MSASIAVPSGESIRVRGSCRIAALSESRPSSARIFQLTIFRKGAVRLILMHTEDANEDSAHEGAAAQAHSPRHKGNPSDEGSKIQHLCCYPCIVRYREDDSGGQNQTPQEIDTPKIDADDNVRAAISPRDDLS